MCPESNQDPPQRRNIDEIRDRIRRRQSGGGAAWRSLWLWPVVIVLIALCWVGFWGWGSYGGWWSRSRNQGSVQSNTQQGNLPANQGPGAAGSPVQNGETAESNGATSGAAILDATNKRAYVGEPFELVVPVLRKVSDSVFWVGTSEAAPMLVVLANAAERPNNSSIHPGERMDIVGTVEQPPATEQAMKNWHLDRSAVGKLEDQGAYVKAAQATPLAH
jgi:hypothetical protein